MRHRRKRDEIINVSATTEYSSLTPAQIVPKLGGKGRYIASEKPSISVLSDRKLNKRRSRTKP
ncbi:unnamed protein product [Acidithrix sp. C25]|nr:unnamed protein product [Acidithrix sp. C25]